jgi:hypothetical protein
VRVWSAKRKAYSGILGVCGHLPCRRLWGGLVCKISVSKVQVTEQLTLEVVIL